MLVEAWPETIRIGSGMRCRAKLNGEFDDTDLGPRPWSGLGPCSAQVIIGDLAPYRCPSHPAGAELSILAEPGRHCNVLQDRLFCQSANHCAKLAQPPPNPRNPASMFADLGITTIASSGCCRHGLLPTQSVLPQIPNSAWLETEQSCHAITQGSFPSNNGLPGLEQLSREIRQTLVSVISDGNGLRHSEAPRQNVRMEGHPLLELPG